MKKRQQDQRPGEKQARDLDEVLEERPVAHQAADRVEQRPTGIEADLRDLARAQEIGRREAGSARLQAEPAKDSKTIRARLFQLPMR